MSRAHLELLATLSEQYPAAFPQDPKAIRPLKVGIHQDLHAALPEVSHAMIRKAMVHHTRRLAYLRAVIRGGDRVDLQGNAVEPVTPDQQKHAAEKLKEAQAHLQAKKAAQASAESLRAEEEEQGKDSSAEAKKAAQAKPEPAIGRMRPVLSLKEKATQK